MYQKAGALGAALWPRGQGLQPMVEHTAEESRAPDDMAACLPCPALATAELHALAENPLGLSRISNKNTIRCQATILPEPQRAALPCPLQDHSLWD